MTRTTIRTMPQLQSLIADPTGPNVTCVGGGHGLAQVLKGVRDYASAISAIVSVADDGGSSGRLVSGLDMPPPGDIRRCMLALTPDDSTMRRLFSHRFDAADVGGHSLGNLILAALTEVEDGFEEALLTAAQLLGCVGQVIPAAPKRLRMEAVIDGVVVEGQETISKTRGQFESVRLLPETVVASASAITAIEAADQIILGPGSLYTSVIASVLAPGLVEAINASSARLVFVGNLITQDGETLGLDGPGHLDALISLTSVRVPDAIVAEASSIEVEGPGEPVVYDPDVMATYGVDVVLTDVTDKKAPWPQHDPVTLGIALKALAEWPGQSRF